MSNAQDHSAPLHDRALPNWSLLGARVRRGALVAATLHLADRSEIADGVKVEAGRASKGPTDDRRCGE